MKKVLGSIISSTQLAFVLGRQISDNVLVGYECINAMRNKRRGKTGYVAIKIDMSKAYDRVEWVFLEVVMRRMNFRESWIQKIMNCISSINYLILINGKPQASFKPSRGIRQGDPLSPYMFLLCAEGLSTFFKNGGNFI